MKVVSVFNLKGGVAKTISAVNIATILAMKEKKVLLIDNDPQANACINMGLKQLSTYKGIFELLTEKELKVENVIVNINENLDLIPSNIKYFDVEKKLSHELNPYNVLKRKLASIREKYDYIIIDNHPSISTMSLNGLVASDEVIIPVTPDNFAIEGIGYLFDKINEVIEELNYDLKVKGVFLTRYKETNLCREIMEYLKEQLPTHLFNTKIRDTTKVGESTIGEPLVLYDKNATATQDYNNLVAEAFNIK